MSPRRSNRVAEFGAVVVAYVAGVGAALAPPSPTGRPLLDALLLGLSVGIVTYAGASAPWWVVVVAAGAAMVASANVLLLAAALVALALGVWVGLQRRNLPLHRAVAVGTSMNVLAWAELDGFFGLTSIIAVATGVLVFVLGIRRRPRRIRRTAWIGAATVAVLAALATAGLGIAANTARNDLQAGQDQAEAGIDLLEDGEFALAADQFELASTSLRRAHEQLGDRWASAASVVPVVSQHRALAVDLSDAGASATASIADALREIDPVQLRVHGGAIDLAAVRDLDEPFTQIDAALDELAATIDRSRSPWLADPLRDEIDDLDSDIAENAPKLENARLAVALAPAMLGGDGVRTYLVLFTTPAEARGLGGFTGNYAELTIDQGRVAMTGFGRVADLEQQAVAIGARLDGPEEFIADYGQFGFNLDGEGLVGDAAFRNVTWTPHFPWVGEVASDLYEQVTGRAVQGVIAIDPYVLQTLVGYAGDIPLATVPFTLTAANTADFILREQYELAADQPTRIDVLEEAAQRTFTTLLTGEMPDPAALGRDLGPMASERRLLVWTREPAEQDLLRRVGLLGAIPPHDGADGWSFAVTNAAANKIDGYLQRRASYEPSTDPVTGESTGTLTVELTNTAPASGLPEYVLGNAVGLPAGTSRLYVSFYTPMLLRSVTRDGEEVDVQPTTEVGWNVYSRYVNIPVGETVRLVYTAQGHLDRPGELVTWEQPLAQPLVPLD